MTRAPCIQALDVPLPAPYPGPPTLVHNDLFPEHVLVDSDGEICAVIDWADAACADPAGDFAIAMFLGGESMLRNALEAYGREFDDHFESRARFYGRGMAVGQIQYGVEADSPKHQREGIDALDPIGL